MIFKGIHDRINGLSDALAQVEVACADRLEHSERQLRADLVELRADLRAMRSTLDSLLVRGIRPVGEDPAPGLAALLAAEAVPEETEEEAAEREREQEELDQFKKAWSTLYGDGDLNGEH